MVLMVRRKAKHADAEDDDDRDGIIAMLLLFMVISMKMSSTTDNNNDHSGRFAGAVVQLVRTADTDVTTSNTLAFLIGGSP